MKCQYPGCHKKTAQYFICWNRGGAEMNPSLTAHSKGCGYVCARHDKVIGRTNLIKGGMSLEEAIEWETANRIK